MSRNFLFAAAVVFALFIPARSSGDTVLVATRRAGWVEFISPDTLKTINRFEVGKLAESAVAAEDGRTLFVAKALRSEPNGCCAIYAIDLEKGAASWLAEPAQTVAVSAAAGRLFTQQGHSGVEVFDTKTLKPLPKMTAPGVYSLHPSPDGHLLFGTTEWDGPSLDIFDLDAGQLISRLTVWIDAPSGTWMGDRFYLYAFDGRFGHLWTVRADTLNLADMGKIIRFPDLVTFQEARSQSLIASTGHLFLYEQFGTKPDDGKPRRGGFFEIDPATGGTKARVAPELHLGKLVAGPGGDTLYGIDVVSGNGGAPSLISLDRQSGQIKAKRSLEPDVWNLSLADIPSEILQRRIEIPAANPGP